jgi:fructose-1,6-bisphosphatase
MSKLTEEEKKHRNVAAQLKWRSQNRATYNQLMLPISRRYYIQNKEVQNKKALGRYYYKKECQIFRNILIDP